MGVDISYMGTKSELVPAVADVIGHAQPGIMLDAFAGMCSVGEAVASSRQIWSNDIQVFASEIGKALFTSHDEPANTLLTAETYFSIFEEHRYSLAKQFAAALKAEDEMIDSSSFRSFSRNSVRLTNVLKQTLARVKRPHFNLFIRTYANNYFGVRQALETDAIIKSIWQTSGSHSITRDRRRWLTIGLGRAILRISNSTGHFAQFLKPKSTSYARYIRQRQRSLWGEWLFSVGSLAAVGTMDWRRRNRAFNQDSLRLLPTLKRLKERPSVIYADPPYTDDQYSRYYHILDTLMLYDYPTVSGAGLYRPGRFTTPFSIKSKTVGAFDKFVRTVAATGADLVLSYPSNGLVHETGTNPQDLLRKYFRRVECCHSLRHSHSTFGASKGEVRSKVTELIYLAKP